MESITGLEHQSLKIGGGQLTDEQVSALDKAQKRAQKIVFNWVGPKEIKLTQMVGILVAPNACLEILPKIDGRNDTRIHLVKMIAIAENLNISDGDISGHNKSDTILEILIGLFARKLLAQVRRGLSRNYQGHSDDLPKLRGKLNIIRQFSKFASSPQIIACNFDEFTANNPLNRLLLCVVVNLRAKSNNYENQRLLREIEAHFEDVELVTPRDALIPIIKIDRNLQKWEMLEKLARFLLKNIFQTTHSGEQDGFSLLFDMNLLFEKYIAAIARKTFTPIGWVVSAQCPQEFLANCKENDKEIFLMKPDLHLQKGDKIIVIDTKWKTFETETELQPSQADAYQMFAYSSQYSASETILLYPHSKCLGAAGIKNIWVFNNSNRNLKAATIDLSDLQSVAKNLCGIVEDDAFLAKLVD